ncbi:MAG: crotonase/enoyl-CoA hydratase family protein [Alcanivoracaceae bacterium]
MSELVTITVADHVAHVVLNRPDKLNALSPPMFEAIIAAAERLRTDTRVRAVVLSGAGRGFCAGLDLANFADPGFVQDFFEGDKAGYWPNFYQQPGYAWKQVPVPVIAALHGVVFGGGIQIALGADIRIAAPDTRLSVMEVRWGLIPDMSGSQTLRDLVRLDVAKELVFTGRIVEADEAARIGLVTRLADDPVAEALALAGEIAGRNPEAVSLAKYLLEHSRHGDALAGLEMEECLQKRLLTSPNQIEAVQAGTARRPAVFQPRRFADYDEIRR